MRDTLDRYYTPEWVTLALLQYLEARGLEIPGWVLEPCAGNGGISSVLSRAGHPVVTGDIVPGHDFQWDFSKAPAAQGIDLGEVPAVVMNPPFRIRQEGKTLVASHFLTQALGLSDFVCMLARVTWFEPCKDREPIQRLMPPSHVLVLPRPSFITPGVDRKPKATDATTVCWYIWTPGSTGTRVDWLGLEAAKDLGRP